MSISEDDASTKPANNHNGMTSERARTIARRAFLRKSVGVAAPVVMTLQSGPAAAIQSITCQHKTPIDNVVFDAIDGINGKALHPRSGFIDLPSFSPTDVDDGLASNNRIDLITGGYEVDFTGKGAGDPSFLNSAGQRLATNDGFARCEPTSTGASAWTPAAGGPPDNPYTFDGPDGGESLAPNSATGPIALHTIGPDGEDQFAGCYGDAGIPADARPLTCSCWSSLHPGP